MFRKLPKKACFIHKQELHITLHQKFGRTSHTTTNQIFGHWAAYSTKASPLSHLLELRICRVYTRKCWEVFILRSPQYFLVNLRRPSSLWCRWPHKWDPAAKRSWTCRLSERSARSCSQKTSFSTRSRKWTSWAPFGCQRICSTWPIDCLSPTMTLTEALERRKRCCADELMKGARCCQTLIATVARSGFRAMLRSTRRQRWTQSHKKVGLTSWGRLGRAEGRHITKVARTQDQ